MLNETDFYGQENVPDSCLFIWHGSLKSQMTTASTFGGLVFADNSVLNGFLESVVIAYFPRKRWQFGAISCKLIDGDRLLLHVTWTDGRETSKCSQREQFLFITDPALIQDGFPQFSTCFSNSATPVASFSEAISRVRGAHGAWGIFPARRRLP